MRSSVDRVRRSYAMLATVCILVAASEAHGGNQAPQCLGELTQEEALARVSDWNLHLVIEYAGNSQDPSLIPFLARLREELPHRPELAVDYEIALAKLPRPVRGSEAERKYLLDLARQSEQEPSAKWALDELVDLGEVDMLDFVRERARQLAPHSEEWAGTLEARVRYASRGVSGYAEALRDSRVDLSFWASEQLSKCKDRSAAAETLRAFIRGTVGEYVELKTTDRKGAMEYLQRWTQPYSQAMWSLERLTGERIWVDEPVTRFLLATPPMPRSPRNACVGLANVLAEEDVDRRFVVHE